MHVRATGNSVCASGLVGSPTTRISGPDVAMLRTADGDVGRLGDDGNHSGQRTAARPLSYL
eukprot:3300289-Lingulodinium_polyedra.AAC.1